MPDIDTIIAKWKASFAVRARYEGQEPREDELLVAEVERLRAMLSIPLADGTRLAIGDCFAVEGVYPFFSDGHENYNAELCWDDESKAMFYDIYPVSDRVSGRACGGSMEDVPHDLIVRRPSHYEPHPTEPGMYRRKEDRP